MVSAAGGQQLRSSRSAPPVQPGVTHTRPNAHHDPHARRPAFQDASRLKEDLVTQGEPPGGRASRTRKQTTPYSDGGASTRKKTWSDDVEDMADILASLSGGASSVDARTKEEKNPAHVRAVDKRNSESKLKIKEAAALKKEIEIAEVKRLADALMLTKSWLDRKEDAFLAYAWAVVAGGGRMAGYKAAAKAACVSQRTCESWCPDFIENGGEFSASMWGSNVKMESAFSDPEVKLAGAKWWRDHAPKKGDPQPRMCDFREFMLGTDNQPGPIREVMELAGKEDYSEEMFRQFTHELGFSYQDMRKGTFNDAHESLDNQHDRRNRFFPEYFHYYENSPHMYKGHDVDDLEDIKIRDSFFIHVSGRDGKVRKINLGGELPPGTITCLIRNDCVL
jgi:hypothetical protein